MPVMPPPFEQGRQRLLARSAILAALHATGRAFVSDVPVPTASSRILLIRPDHLGDILFSSPAIRHLRSRLPQASLHYLAGPWAQDLLTRNAHLDGLIACPFPWFSGHRPHPALHYYLLLRQALHLRRHRFAASLNLRFDFWWGAALAYLAGIPYRLGYATPLCRQFLSAPIRYQPGEHEVLQNLRLVDHLLSSMGAASDGDIAPSLDFVLHSDERSFAEHYLAKHNPDQRPLVVIHPAGRSPIKRWPAERFAAVANALHARHNTLTVISGSRPDRGMAEQIASLVDGPVVVAAGETTIGTLAALMERAVLVVGVDTGPLHIAVALGRPTVHLFGPADHRTFGPFGDPRRHLVVRAELDCSPCGKFEWSDSQLADHNCMSEITVEQVVHAATQVLGIAAC